MSAIPTEKCPKCGEWKTPDEFGKANDRDGHRSWCKECDKARVREWKKSARKPQPPKSDAANRTHDLIEARLGFWPLGCVIPPVLPTGAPARYCPLLPYAAAFRRTRRCCVK